jgi:hypothetical protein
MWGAERKESWREGASMMLVEGKDSGERGRLSTLGVAEAEAEWRWLLVIVLVDVLLPWRWLLNGWDLFAVRISSWKGKYPLYIEACCQQSFSWTRLVQVRYADEAA